jgi:hypothetical protein
MQPSPAEPAEGEVFGASTVRRIAWLTLAIGSAAALGAEVISRQWRWAAGLAIGTFLGWLNFRLLRRGAEAMVAAAATQKTSEKPRTPALTSWTAALRYGLIGLSVYVIFKYLHVPLVSLVAGLCALGVATIAASVWAILNPEK